MIKINPKYIINKQSKREAVILPYSEWEKILEDMEELEDIRAYDFAKSESDEIVPFDKAVQEIKDGKIN